LSARCSSILGRPRRLLLVVALLATALAGARSAGAQDADRPRVGLVLGGGGARGAAHVGVLQVLEELRVPVDVVVGTSMGSIIGGLYAVGYAPDEMARIFQEARWDLLLSDEPPRDAYWFRRRQDDRRFLVDLELGWRDGGPALPPGLILGRNIELFLGQLLLPAASTTDFDELRLPFRCIAADLADGSTVILEGGSLAHAIRASMSIPGVFAPVELDGRVLVDGGVVDNVPIDVARSLGADVVIVVDVSTPLGDATAFRSLFGVSGRVVGLLTAANQAASLDSLRAGDIGIRPELEGVGTLGFDRAVDAIEIGRRAAEDARASFAPLQVDELTWRAWRARQRLVAAEPPVLRQLVIESDSKLAPQVLQERAALAPGDKVDAAAIAKVSERLAGLGIFQHVDFALAPVSDVPGEVDLLVLPTEKEWGPHYLRLGLGVASDLRGRGEFDIGVQHTWTPINSLGGEWRNEAQVGTRTRLYTEFYQPIDPGLRWFIAPSLLYEQDELDLIVDGDPVATSSAEALEGAIALGRNLADWGELRVAYSRVYGTLRPRVALPGLLPDKVDIETDAVTTTLLVDTLDSSIFPRDGLLGDVRWRVTDEALRGASEGSTLEMTLGAPFTRGELTLFPKISGGTTLDDESPIGGQFTLGGFQRLSGLAERELAGNHYGLGVLQLYRELEARSSQLGMATYLGGTLELGGVWADEDDVSSDELLFGGSLYLAVDSIVGPAYLGFGLTEGGDTAVYVYIGAVL